jgi:predicted flap endonuclease-1-like 5' DNA nuclease
MCAKLRPHVVVLLSFRRIVVTRSLVPSVMFVLGLLVGILGGWLLWGRRRRSTAVPAVRTSAPVSKVPHRRLPESQPVAQAAGPDSPATVEPVAVAPAAVESPAVEPAVVESDAVEPAAIASEGEPATTDASPAEPVAGPAVEVPAPRVAANAPDDLKRIEGIGPKMASALNAAGISTFKDLAEADESTLRAAVAAAGMRLAPSLVTWPTQARLLADGAQVGLATRN